MEISGKWVLAIIGLLVLVIIGLLVVVFMPNGPSEDTTRYNAPAENDVTTQTESSAAASYKSQPTDSQSTDTETSAIRQSASAAASKQQSSSDTIYQVGDEVVVGDITYIIDDAYLTNTVGGFEPFLETADGVYVVIYAIIENSAIGSSNRLFVGPDIISLVDSNGKEYDVDIAATSMGKSIYSAELIPLYTVEGELIYDVPIGESYCVKVTDGKRRGEERYIMIGST